MQLCHVVDASMRRAANHVARPCDGAALDSCARIPTSTAVTTSGACWLQIEALGGRPGHEGVKSCMSWMQNSLFVHLLCSSHQLLGEKAQAGMLEQRKHLAAGYPWIS